ncbi:MAG: sugar ABC transporter substrate-binding protein [Microbacteriaceae bacterium]|nr:sugar ABC transporter substrate-binding protein [Microbacteriaceae bacterium]
MHTSAQPRRSRSSVTRSAAVGLALAMTLVGCSNVAVDSSDPSDGPSTGSDELKPFVWDQDGGEVPDLPHRIAWANTAAVEFFLAFSDGMEEAANDRGVEYLTAIADNNPEKNIQQIESFLSRGVGALMYQPLDMASQVPLFERALDDGIFLPGLISHPSTLQIAASQYDIGFTQGEAAAKWAVENLGGEAEVHYFNLDTIGPQLVLRHEGVLDGLATGGPGIKVVSDIGTAVSTEDGFEVMSTVLQAHPEIDIVLGGDAVVVGALKAIEAAGMPTDLMYLSGVDGDKQALAAIKEGGAYKASIAFPWQLMGYGIGQFSADWLEGKEVPRVMVAAATLLDSPAAVDEFIEVNANPSVVFADRERFESYLPLLGQVSYATRDLVWDSEYVPE